MENVTVRRIDVNVRHTLVVLDVVLQTHAQILALPMVPVRKVWNVFVMKDIVEIHVLKDVLDVRCVFCFVFLRLTLHTHTHTYR